ncbi:hypothetical protein Patl1_09669 [Pistacia atlantica]|uniref:Uncharacterized protein n=1 Tax=Pistacia atlantica TaxID=434234 RepID=A0ACC1A6F8_9ROSI|nr:hypothetical protein Patl1_09669 [Pistacia atlantica]
MALRWIVHTACNVLGYDQNHPNNIHCKNAMGYQNQVHPQGLLNNTSKVTSSSSNSSSSSGFQMPLHYPRYSKADYEKMGNGRSTCFSENMASLSRAPSMRKELM